MIPLATTTITVLRQSVPDQYDDPYSGHSAADRTEFATGVRAVIDRPAGREQVAGGEQSIADLELVCDPVGLDYRDLIRDDSSGRVYRLVWALSFPGEHEEAALRIVEGET